MPSGKEIMRAGPPSAGTTPNSTGPGSTRRPAGSRREKSAARWPLYQLLVDGKQLLSGARDELILGLYRDRRAKATEQSGLSSPEDSWALGLIGYFCDGRNTDKAHVVAKKLHQNRAFARWP